MSVGSARPSAPPRPLSAAPAAPKKKTARVPGAPDDSPLVFDPQWHTYRHRGQKLVSVTSLVKKWAKPFDAEAIAVRVAMREGSTPEDVLKAWEAKRDRAASLGTAVHAYAERVALARIAAAGGDGGESGGDGGAGGKAAGGGCDAPELPARAVPFCRAVDAAYRDYRIEPAVDPTGRFGAGVERMVCWPRFGIAGTIDLIARVGGGDGDGDGVAGSAASAPWLLDWKTNERIDKSNGFGDFMAPPLDHLPDCNFFHYTLQLSTYRVILEEFYGEAIAGQSLIHLGEAGDAGAEVDAGKYEMIPVPYLRDESLEVLRLHFQKTFDWFA